MTQSRDSLISLTDTPYYHCISRCVRRAFLCGEDPYTGKSFDHRRPWMIDRIRQLTNVFAIEVCAYAIMSNHYHLVLFVNQAELEAYSDEDVCKRWERLYSMPDVVTAWRRNELTSDIQINSAIMIITEWRERLGSISWFMRGLNEFIARKSNAEDNCKGRFWEGRFKSQALLDENAILTCMAYVDLNPIRAKMASKVEDAEFTSIFDRIHDKSHHLERKDKKNGKPLVKFVGAEHKHRGEGLCFNLLDYIELVDWTGRIIRDDKRGAISSNEPCLVHSLGLDTDTWVNLASHFGKDYHGAVGSLDELALFAEHTGRRWVSGKNKLDKIYH